MISGQDLIIEIQELMIDLKANIQYLKKSGRKKSQTEHDYRVKKSQEMLRLKAEGGKVTGLIDIVRGLPHVAKLCLERDIAENMYQTNLQNIYFLKMQIGILDKQIGREHGNGSRL
jgi:hypothetical protein